MNDRPHDTRPRRALRDVVSDIDRDILKLLLRRRNLLTRMYNSKGFLEPSEEKILRKSWEAAVSRVSRDARLSGRFFSLMQEVEFLPRPGAGQEDQDAPDRGADRRTAFNLAPPARPVRLLMPAPLACRATRAWLMLAAATGQGLRLAPCLMNDPIVDCVKMLNQLGAGLNREEDGVTAHETAPVGAPDKVLYAGDSAWNFFLLLGHYLGRPSRAKISGESALKLADFSSTRRFLPALGARLVHVVPKSNGLPARLECSGILPDTATLPADVPAELAEGILLAAPLYERALTLDLAAHPLQKLILARTLPILRAAGADVVVENARVRVAPSPLRLPPQPELPLEPELAVFLLALPLALGGEARLAGIWPQWPGALAGWDLLQALGLDLRQAGGEIRARAATPLKDFPAQALAALSDFPADWTPLPLALAACAALRGGEAVLPPLPSAADTDEVASFLHAVGLESDAEGKLCKSSQEGIASAWNAPTPTWALGLALAACARPHLKLGNPGIMTALYPAFWSLYNGLPEPSLRRAAVEESVIAPARRRILTTSVAVPPAIRDEDA
ncbi:3-phosphoshikimate 1-carboxyvinyltransferase [Desulfovibrio sp. ZJ369]|uniref:3-phosphoshikimate 1-carboxyvinyltransferase n=1 Tax=Desulfovibrio sp. ZJ369 TaxID=2709793 RepID=UPI0013EC36BD|nr:3-phosphoshikimate 1-carboxyvinyltransferase [Desulfovibrio sp. ZJ369]